MIQYHILYYPRMEMCLALKWCTHTVAASIVVVIKKQATYKQYYYKSQPQITHIAHITQPVRTP